jgi:hypothetical protein
MVDRAAAFNAQRVNFVITHYFVDDNGDSAPDWYCLRQDQDFPCEKFGRGARMVNIAVRAMPPPMGPHGHLASHPKP